MKTLTEKIDWWIFRAYAPAAGGLPLFRIFFACFLLVFYLPRNSLVSTLPQSFFEPRLGPGMLFTGFPPQWFFRGTDYLLELGAFCLLFGYRTRFFSLLLAGLIVLVNSFQYATGKVGHDILVPATLFCLAWSDWGRRYSADARRLPPASRSRAPAWPLTLLVFTISLCMLTAAISKAKSGWLDPHLECCRGQLLLNYIGLGRAKVLADYMAAINSPIFWKFLDVGTVVLEGAFVFAMFWLPAIRFVAAATCLFHAFIYFSMDILFIANPAAYASLVDFRFLLRHRWARLFLRHFTRCAYRIRFLPLAAFVALLYGAYLGVGTPDWKDNVILDSVAALIVLLAGTWAMLFLFLQAMDCVLWKVRFPVRRGAMIVLYDGECGLCDAWVQFVLKHDRRGTIQFAPLQSDVGRKLSGVRDDEVPDMSTIVLWVQGRTYRRSDAISMILRQMGFPWSPLGAMGLVPRFLRNWAYDFVAARRHKWFPKAASCRLPTPDEKSRFLA